MAKQGSIKSSSQEGKRSWLSKLMKNKAAALEQLGDKLTKGAYLEPMSQEEVRTQACSRGPASLKCRL